MKSILLTALLVMGSVHANDELVFLDNLIKVTEENLNNQKELRIFTQEYLEQLNIFLKNDEDKEQLLRVAKKAKQVMILIQENHLEQAFESKFLSELGLFAKFANKTGIPKP